MHSLRIWLSLVGLLGHIGLAGAVSDAPLRALNAYIEQNGSCSEQVIDWNRRYNPKVIAGETARHFYYRAIAYQNWGKCDKPYFRPILGELQKASIIFAKGKVTEAEFEAKEAELINLWFRALKEDERGEELVRAYEAKTASRLISLIPPKQFFDCTFFGDKPHCAD